MIAVGGGKQTPGPEEAGQNHPAHRETIGDSGAWVKGGTIQHIHEKAVRNDKTTSCPVQTSLPGGLKPFHTLEILEETHKNNLE